MDIKTKKRQYKIASYNIRMDTLDDGEDRWEKREKNVLRLIEKYQWDLVGLQEVKETQLESLKKLADYHFIGEGRSTDEANEYNLILFNKQKFELLEEETFWLSKTPKVPSLAVEWQADCPRICTWARLKDRETSQELIFVNTHFDHVGEEARYQSALLIKALIETFDPQIPIVLVGDFNGNRSERWYGAINSLLVDALDNTPWHIGPFVTCTGVGFFHESPWDDMQAIDFIFHNSKINVEETSVITDKIKSRYPSDHFPVSMICQI